MQAVLLAAGNSSRLHPFGGAAHKSTITLLGKSLLQRTIEALVSKGITNIVIIDSPENGVKKCLDSFSVPIPVQIVTHSGAKGMGESLLDAREYLEKTFILTHAHHIDIDRHVEMLVEKMSKEHVTLLVKKEQNLSAYGGLRLEGDTVVELIEKPTAPHGLTHKIIGLYGLNEQFLDSLETVNKEHYSFENALCSMIDTKKIKALETEDAVLSLKYPFHVFDILSYILENTDEYRSESSHIAQSAILEGKVIIEDNVEIFDNAVIKGPVYLGKGVVVGTNAVIRDTVSLEEGVKIGANMEVKHSVVGKNSTTHSGFLGDSVVGSSTKLAAQFVSGNVRLDRKEIALSVKGERVPSGHNHLGVFIGNNVRIGITVSTMPGVVIGSNSFVGPHTVVYRNVSEGVKFYSKFEDIIITEDPDTFSVPKQKNTFVLFDIDYTLFDTASFKASELQEYLLYDEVIETLQSLSGVVTLGVFSEGDLDFQKTKLVKTLVQDHFQSDHVHIVSDKHATIQSIVGNYTDETLVLVDDRLDVLKNAKSVSKDVITIWIKRGPFAESADTSAFSPDYAVSSLSDVVKIVSNL